MAEPWTEKYRPRTLDEVVGNPSAVAELRRWAASWGHRIPDKRALILEGEPGVGKTSAAIALANEMGWALVEMNASDARNARSIRDVALRGATQQTFLGSGDYLRTREGGRKLILLDEADNVFGRQDQGGIGAIVDLIRETRQPVVLIANDYYELVRRSSSLRSLCKTVRFQPLHAPSIRSVLDRIARTEGVGIDDALLDYLAGRAGGDLRSAINDLQMIAEGRREVGEAATAVIGDRDRGTTVFAVLREIFESGDARRARGAYDKLDEAPEDFILWVDENLPLAYRNPPDLAAGLDAVGRADQYLGRSRWRQAYGLWSYAADLMTAGVAVARRGRFANAQMRFPLWLAAMSRSRGPRAVRDGLASKIGAHVHLSRRAVTQDVLPVFVQLFKHDADFRLAVSVRLDLSEREIAYLLGEDEDSHEVRHLRESVEKVRGFAEQPRVQPRGLLGVEDEEP